MHLGDPWKFKEMVKTSVRKESNHAANLQSSQNALYFTVDLVHICRTSTGNSGTESAYYGSEVTGPSCFAVHSRVDVNTLLIFQHLAGDILSSSISTYHVSSPKPDPLRPSHMKQCPILHERATYRKVHQANLPTLWSYFFRSFTCQFSVVARGTTPLTGDKQGTLTTHHLNAPE